jgi:hypothetical protein
VADRSSYPPQAYAPTGQLWWRLDTAPGSRRTYGAENKLASWLAFHVEVGDTFTMRQLRTLGWILPSNKDDKTLPPNQYRLVERGWHPGLGPRPRRAGVISSRVRNEVFARDGSRCTVCGVGDREPYPGEPGTAATLTIGHRLAQARGGGDHIDNLRTECSRCNEPLRHEGEAPDTWEDVHIQVRRLKESDRRDLLTWLQRGERSRSALDQVYDRARKLSATDRDRLAEELARTLPRR